MIDLLPAENDVLQRVVTAGADGVPLGDLDGFIGHVVKLALDGLVRVPKGERRVYPTTKGTAFKERVAL